MNTNNKFYTKYQNFNRSFENNNVLNESIKNFSKFNELCENINDNLINEGFKDAFAKGLKKVSGWFNRDKKQSGEKPENPPEIETQAEKNKKLREQYNKKYDEEEREEMMEKAFNERFSEIMTKAKFKQDKDDKNKFYGYSKDHKRILLKLKSLGEDKSIFIYVENDDENNNNSSQINLISVSSESLKISEDYSNGEIKKSINDYLRKNSEVEISFLGNITEVDKPEAGKDKTLATGDNQGTDQPKGDEGTPATGDNQGTDQPKGDEGTSVTGDNQGTDQPKGDEGTDQPKGDEGTPVTGDSQETDQPKNNKFQKQLPSGAPPAIDIE